VLLTKLQAMDQLLIIPPWIHRVPTYMVYKYLQLMQWKS
jgi:hypothetical protein